jgi:hypothetical protein
MSVFDLNFLAITAVAVLNMVLGFLWYSPKVAGKRWLKLISQSETDIEQSKSKAWRGRTYFFIFLGSFVTSFVLANVVFYHAATSVYEGVLSGFWVWLGFVAMTGISSVFFEKKPQELFFINTGFQLLSLVVDGAILAVWR